MNESESIMDKLNSIEGLLNRQMANQKEIMTLGEACDYLEVSRSYVYKLTCNKQIPHYCPTGKKIYFRRSELDEWLLQNKMTSATEIEREAADYVIRKGRR